MKPELKAPGTNLLTLHYDEPLSTFAFKFNLRRYNMAAFVGAPLVAPKKVNGWDKRRKQLIDEVRRCRLTRSNPR